MRRGGEEEGRGRQGKERGRDWAAPLPPDPALPP